jgi:hypothetical protein
VFVGYVKTKDILLHPISLIQMRGWKGYLKLVGRALSRRRYAFIRMTQKSDWLFDAKIRRSQKKRRALKPHRH